MISFASTIDVVPSHIMEAEFFLFEDQAVYFLLSFVFAHDLQEDGAIAVEDLVGFAYSLSGGAAQADVVFVFAGERAEYLIGTA